MTGMTAPTRQTGLTLVELLVAVALLGVVVAMGAVYVDTTERPLEAGGSLLEGLLRQARARSISTTTAHRVAPSGPGSLIVEFGDDCDAATWTQEPRMDVDLPEQVTMSDTTWSVCFSRRGIASDNVTITLDHPEWGSKELEVLRGGVTRWNE